MEVASARAKDGRIHILGEMAKALTNAPRRARRIPRRASRPFKIATDKIRGSDRTGRQR